ncbi:16S rRNA (guanine(966)-N(2))-methyltransferase RsmD [candidate division KSB1 bacterium]|nr:16S rRNA (guanine(966)-N(2))-methyltransferase RsmD [candidate division KSB1 bacterium]
MRVIAGQYKGARLYTPKNLHIRPTTDRVKEYIFSCLMNRISSATILDLFAGTGSLGIEAKSRGAARVDFVDQADQAVNIIKMNMQKLGLGENIFKMNALTFISYAYERGFCYDLIFCDPPYGFEFSTVLQAFMHKTITSPDGLIVYESNAQHTNPVIHESVIVEKEKKLGNTKITFFKMSTL